MYAYIDSFRKFGKTNTDNQSIKIKRPYPAKFTRLFFRRKGQKSRIRSWFTASPGERNALEDFASFRSEYPGGKYATDFPQTHNPHCL